MVWARRTMDGLCATEQLTDGVKKQLTVNLPAAEQRQLTCQPERRTHGLERQDQDPSTSKRNRTRSRSSSRSSSQGFGEAVALTSNLMTLAKS